MIFERRLSYTFTDPILKIHQFCPAFNDSLVLLAQKTYGEDFLLHYDKNGRLLYRYDFGDYIESFCMPNDRQAVVLFPEQGIILVFDLHKQIKMEFKHQFFTQLGCQCNVDYFCDSKYLCVHENGDNESHKIVLTYYNWPFEIVSLDQPPQTVAVFEGEGGVWNPTFQVRKINSHSKYAWNESRHKDQFQVRIHEVKNGKSVYSKVNVKMNPLFQPYGLKSMDAAIIELWEFQPNVLLLYSVTSKDDKIAIRDEITGLNKPVQLINNTFIWDLDLQIIREFRFTFPPKYQDLQVDIVGTPQLSMFRTFYFQPGKAVESPACFISNIREEKVYEETWICSHLQKYRPLESRCETIIEGVFQNENVKEFKLRSISLGLRREMSLYLLKEMQEKPERAAKDSWDSDLLRDIFKMLDYDEQ